MTDFDSIADTHATIRNAYTGGVYYVPAQQLNDFDDFVDEHGVTPPWAVYAGFRIREPARAR